jgi:hypothetical protein
MSMLMRWEKAASAETARGSADFDPSIRAPPEDISQYGFEGPFEVC